MYDAKFQTNILNNLQTTSRQIHILFEQSSALQVLYKVDKHKNTKQPLLFMYHSKKQFYHRFGKVYFLKKIKAQE